MTVINLDYGLLDYVSKLYKINSECRAFTVGGELYNVLLQSYSIYSDFLVHF